MKSEMRLAIERAEKEHAQNRTAMAPPTCTYDVVARCSPHLDSPRHLGPYVRKLDEAVKAGNVECVFHAPPQHGKTIVTEHALIFAVIHDLLQKGRVPRAHAYTTFNWERAKIVRNEVAQLAFLAGLDPHPAGNVLTLQGGATIKFGGAGTGYLTGSRVDGIHVIDDPLKDAKEARSPTIRNDRWDWFTGVAQTRRHQGSSIIAMMTRWHPDDLSGRLIKMLGWEYLRLAAECDSADDPCGRQIGEALWPKHRPSTWLQQFKRSPLTWAAMYQGQPRVEGDAAFDLGYLRYYDALPEGGFRSAYGADLAYTTKTRSDWNVLLRGRLYAKELYLTGMIRKQCQADQFTRLMKQQIEIEPGPILWFGATTERGVAQLIRAQGGVHSFLFEQATEDKYVRAQPTIEGFWNQQRVLVPAKAPWREAFEDEVCSFTGMNDDHDDIVDAFAALGRLFLRGLAGKMGVGALNRQIRGALQGEGRARLRLIG